MVNWKCDMCGKDTQVNPPTKPVTEKKTVVVDIPDPDHVKTLSQEDQTRLMAEYVAKTYKGPTKELKHEQDVPVMKTMKRQNAQTGEIEDIPVQEIKDLSPRTYITQLTVGPEMIQKDFCKDCLTKEILPILQPLWDKLASVKSQ